MTIDNVYFTTEKVKMKEYSFPRMKTASKKIQPRKCAGNTASS